MMAVISAEVLNMSQCGLTQLTASEYFTAKFLTRQTNVSISMKLDTSICTSPKPTSDFQIL